MSEQDEINKLIGQSFQRHMEISIFKGLIKVSTASKQPQNPLTVGVLEDALASLYPQPEYMFFVSMISVCDIWRQLKKQGFRVKRVKKHNTLKIYTGFRPVGDLHVDPWNNIPAGKMLQIKKTDFHIKVDSLLNRLSSDNPDSTV